MQKYEKDPVIKTRLASAWFSAFCSSNQSRIRDSGDCSYPQRGLLYKLSVFAKCKVSSTRPPKRKGGCQPRADWRVVSTELIFMVAPEYPAWRVYCISSPGGTAKRRACTAVCCTIRKANRIELRSGAESGAKVLLPVVTRKLLQAAKRHAVYIHCGTAYGSMEVFRQSPLSV